MKRKINLNRPEVSSEEIQSRKNFDSVLKSHVKVSGKPLLKKPWFLSSLVVATVVIVFTAVLLKKNPQGNNKNSNPESNISATDDSLALQAFYKIESSKTGISPPLKGLNVPYTIYNVVAEKGAKLDFTTGSKLIIPKNVFVDETGKLLKGEVELRYREFHDAADFFISGIPMTYDSAGVKYQFESAGMMEMIAFQNGKQVYMAPQKSIHVELVSNFKGTEYNLYKLDTLKNNWSCLGKDKVKAIQSVNPITELKNLVIKETPEYKALETKKSELQNSKVTQIAALPKPEAEPIKPKQVKNGKYTFNIDVDSKEFPELAVYQGVLFEVGDENVSFNKSMYDITWDEAIIYDGTKKGENYNLTLKKSSKKYDLIVYPVFEGKNLETALKTFQDKFEKYKTTLDKRIASEKRIEADYQTKLAMVKKQQQELEARWKKQMDDQFRNMSTEEKVSRMFSINSFGIFNCDNPSVYPQGVKCSVVLKGDKDRNLKCYDVYLVDKQKNGLFTFSKNPITTFSFNPQSVNMLWTVEDGVLYWLKPDQFKNITGASGLSNIVMNRVNQKFTTVEELKTYLNF